jgi:poly(A) polymerase
VFTTATENRWRGELEGFGGDPAGLRVGGVEVTACAAELLDAVCGALARQGGEGWIVGGAVRDRLLGRESADMDVATRGDPRALAGAVARALGAHRFALSEQFGAWRVIPRKGSWQLDVTPLLGATIEEDLAKRDLTINAIALPLRGGDPVDPFGGLEDLRARRLRMVSEKCFVADPLRLLRLARLRAELDFQIEPHTAAAARGAAPGLVGVAAERQFAELARILGGQRPREGLLAAEALGAIGAVLPELCDLRGVSQSRFHHLDVHDHTLEVLEQTVALARDPEVPFPGLGGAVSALLEEQLAGGLTRGAALRFGALLHDIAKPRTRERSADGRVTFIGHDELGAELSRSILRRLRAGERLADHVAALARHHLRLGFMVHQAPPAPRAIYRYLKDCGPVGVDVTLLSVADRLATGGDGSQRAIAAHLELAQTVLAAALAWRTRPPRPPIDGGRLAAALGLKPGPVLGKLLAELEEDSYAGEVGSEDEAIRRARMLLAGRPRSR